MLIKRLSDQEQDTALLLLAQDLDREIGDEAKEEQIAGIRLQTNEEKALPYFRKVLQTANSPSIKCLICWILEGRADASWIPDLSRLVVHNHDTGVQIAAAIVLRFIGDPRAIPALQHAQAHAASDIKGQRLRDLARDILVDLES